MIPIEQKPYCLIRGYDGATLIYERKVDAGQITDEQMIGLLKALTAKAGLGFDEIVGAYARRRTKIANSQLEVWREKPYQRYTCGTDPFFVAEIFPRPVALP